MVPRGGGSETKLLAYGKNGGSQTGINVHGNDPDYCTLSADYKTVTFVKACSGIIGFNPMYGTMAGTASVTSITTGSSYTDELYSFTANVGDTITFSSQYWWGYEVIGS